MFTVWLTVKVRKNVRNYSLKRLPDMEKIIYPFILLLLVAFGAMVKRADRQLTQFTFRELPLLL